MPRWLGYLLFAAGYPGFDQTGRPQVGNDVTPDRLIFDLPTTAGPNGRILPDWGKAPGGVAPGVWSLAPDQPGGGMVRVVVTGGDNSPIGSRVSATANPPTGNGLVVIGGRPGSSRPLPVLPCVHRSPAPTGEAPCGPCGGRTRLKVYGCSVFGRATIGTRVDGVAGCCSGCPKYQPLATPETDR